MRGITQFEVNGKPHIFNQDVFRSLFVQIHLGNKCKTISEIADKANVSEETVKSWVKGQNGPSGLDSIKWIAIVLGCDYTKLLKECPKEEKVKDGIYIFKEDEKRIPRMIYGMMCELVNSIDWEPFDPNIPDLPCRIPLMKKWQKGWTKEQLRNYYYLAIKKSALDLPRETREQLVELVDDIFGPFDLDGTEEGIFEGNAYNEYLKTNGWEDSTEVRLKFCVVFQEEAGTRLDQIFEKYLCK